MGEKLKISKILNFKNQNLNLAVCLKIIKNSTFNGQIPTKPEKLLLPAEFSILRLTFYGVSLKVLNSGIIQKTFTHALHVVSLKSMNYYQACKELTEVFLNIEFTSNSLFFYLKHVLKSFLKVLVV